MSTKKPRAWFVNLYSARITQRAVNQWDEFHAKNGAADYFQTWDEAHAHLLLQASVRLKKAKAELPNAERNLARVKALAQPASNNGGSA